MSENRVYFNSMGKLGEGRAALRGGNVNGDLHLWLVSYIVYCTLSDVHSLKNYGRSPMSPNHLRTLTLLQIYLQPIYTITPCR
jgi:hypothetical protein